jgi:hypothetical protein
MTQDHVNMIAALAAANDREREPTAGCPSGRSKWHTAGRLMDRVAGYLVRRGLAATRTTLGVTRWALTEDGLRVAQAGRRAARQLAAQGSE